MAIKSLNQFRDVVGEWADEQFPGQPAINPLIGGDEERGESIARFVLKTNQGIRDEVLKDERMSAEIGDLCIFHANYCHIYGLDMGYYPEWTPVTINSRERAWRESLYAFTHLVAADDEGDPGKVQEKSDKYLSTIHSVANFLGFDMVDCMESRFDEISEREWDSAYKKRAGGD